MVAEKPKLYDVQVNLSFTMPVVARNVDEAKAAASVFWQEEFRNNDTPDIVYFTPKFVNKIDKKRRFELPHILSSLSDELPEVLHEWDVETWAKSNENI